jgi:hypothetical protein
VAAHAKPELPLCLGWAEVTSTVHITFTGMGDSSRPHGPGAARGDDACAQSAFLLGFARVCVCACTLPMPTSATHEGARAHACLHSFALCSRAHTLLQASDFGITCAPVVLFALTGTSGSQTRYTPWQVGGLHVTSDAAPSAALCRRPMVSLLVQLH